MAETRGVLEARCATPRKPSFRFEYTEEAAQFNVNILKRVNYNMCDAIQAERGSTMWYGSEYRPVAQLERLYRHHKDWQYFRTQLEKGATYPLRKIGPRRRIDNIRKMLQRGNHRSAEDNSDEVKRLTEDDVKKGFAIPLPREAASLIKHGEVYPVGLVSNHTFNDEGEPIVRYRLTHDLSFPIKKGVAINDRVDKDRLVALQYGFAFLRSLHLIHRIRQENSNGVILINKRDLKDAYRRVHTWANIAAACMILVKNFSSSCCVCHLDRRRLRANSASAAR